MAKKRATINTADQAGDSERTSEEAHEGVFSFSHSDGSPETQQARLDNTSDYKPGPVKGYHPPEY